MLRRGADRPARDRRRARRAEPGQAARRRAGRRRAGPRAGPAVARPRRAARAGGRAHAGRDERRRRQRRRRASRAPPTGEAVAVTLELWADPENDAERSCCSASAVAQARSLAHSMGLPHFTIDLREEFRAGVVEPFIAGYAAGETPNPCVGCNGHVRLDAMLELADRLGRGAAGHRPLRPDRPRPSTRAVRCCASPPTRPRTRPTCWRRSRPASLARMRFPLGELTKPEVREIAARPGCRWPARPTRRTCASWPAPPGRASWPATAALGDRPGDDRRAPPARVLGHHLGQHRFTVGQRRGIGLSAGEPLYVLDKDPDGRRRDRRPRVGAAHRAGRLRGARLHRPGLAGRPGQAALSLAPAAGHACPATRPPGATARWRSTCRTPSRAPHPGSWPA